MQEMKIEKDWDYRFPWAIKTLQSLKLPAGSLVFDIGSGNALLRKAVEDSGLRYRAYDIVAADGVEKWDVETPFPYAERPAAVLFLEVVEHLNNPWLCLKNIAGILPSGSHLLLSTPNPGWSDSRMHMLRKGLLTMFTQNDLDVNHHVFTPWKHILVKLLSDNDLRVLHCGNIGKKTNLTAKPFWGTNLPVRLLYRCVKKFIEWRQPDAIGSLYGIIAKKN